MPSDLNFAGFEIHLYSVFFGLGLGVGYFTALKLCRRFNISESIIDSLALALLIFGMLGARLFYVAGHWDYYQYHYADIIQFWRGGLAFYGGLLGGGLGFLIVWLYKRFEILKTLDVLAPGLALGQAIGRLGNYFNREAFGPPTDLPWKMFVPENLRPPAFADQSFFHPVMFYESLGLLIIFLVLLKLSKFSVKPGALFGAYAITAGILRFNLEFLRVDALAAGGLMLSQVAAILFMLLGLFIFYKNAAV